MRLQTRLPFFSLVLSLTVAGVLLSACENTLPGSGLDSESANQDTPQVQLLGEPARTLADVEQGAEQEVSQDQQSDTLQTPGNEVTNHRHTFASHIRFTDSTLDIWPPQPIDIANVTVVAATDASNSEEKISHPFETDSSIVNSLGTRYEILVQHIVRDKSGTTTHTEIEIYNYDNNQVITVTLDASSTKIIDHSINEAYIYQPPESKTEVARAIELAADHLTRQGFTDHRNLIGTGLLAFPSAVQTAASGASFFAERKIYVTFGEGNGTLPGYRALVNLSTDTVEHSGSIQ